MYERFTDRARKVMQLANQEAQRFNHEYIGTEHILLGLVKEGSGVAANVLNDLDLRVRTVRLEIEKIVQAGPGNEIRSSFFALPQTPRTKRVLEFAVEESRNLGHDYIGTEHLLFGLLREPEGTGAQVLINLGLKLDDIRAAVRDRLGHPEPEEPMAPSPNWVREARADEPRPLAANEPALPADARLALEVLEAKAEQLNREKREAREKRNAMQATDSGDQADQIIRQLERIILRLRDSV
jgi:ATP-dependent Clp protease ATP-binding subunit ClpA